MVVASKRTFDQWQPATEGRIAAVGSTAETRDATAYGCAAICCRAKLPLIVVLSRVVSCRAGVWWPVSGRGRAAARIEVAPAARQ
jgi:hypothetical protein